MRASTLCTGTGQCTRVRTASAHPECRHLLAQEGGVTAGLRSRGALRLRSRTTRAAGDEHTILRDGVAHRDDMVMDGIFFLRCTGHSQAMPSNPGTQWLCSKPLSAGIAWHGLAMACEA